MKLYKILFILIIGVLFFFQKTPSVYADFCESSCGGDSNCISICRTTCQAVCNSANSSYNASTCNQCNSTTVGGGNTPVINLNTLLSQGISGGFLAKFNNLGEIISKVLIFAFALAGFGLLIFLIKAGFDFLTSAGDPKKMEGAKNALTAAILGFIVIVVAFWITQIVNYIFGLGGTFG